LNALALEERYGVEWNDHELLAKKEFEEIRAYLEKEYRGATLEKLMEKFGRGINYYNLLFKRHTGISYAEYLKALRLEKAEQLLVTTELPVEEIARQVGYKSESHFYRLIYEKFHALPAEIRRRGGLSKNRSAGCL